MCGRFTLRTEAQAVIKQFQLDFSSSWEPRYNIAPTQWVPVIRGSDRRVAKLRWGLVPFWAKSPREGAKMINARSETVADKPAFRRAARKQRCLIPADGYLEWVRQGKQKQPYYIRLHDERPFLMAGLWERWQDESVEDAAPLETFTILTTRANDFTESVHDRMPVLLSPNDYDLWLDPQVPLRELDYLYEPFASEEMRMDAVTTRVNSVRHDDPQCLEIERSLF